MATKSVMPGVGAGALVAPLFPIAKRDNLRSSSCVQLQLTRHLRVVIFAYAKYW